MTDKVYDYTWLTGHEGNFLKSESGCFLAFRAHPETALRQFVVGGKGVKIILAKFHYMLLQRSGRVSLIDTHFPD